MKDGYSAQDQHRINEMNTRLREIEMKPDAKDLKELKKMSEELTEIHNKYREEKKISPLVNFFTKTL